MPSLTLKGIPDDMLARLHQRAEAERRSLNQQTLYLLERALDEPRLSFADAHRAFADAHGQSPFTDESLDQTLLGLRSADPGRSSATLGPRRCTSDLA